jgi:hypothetical protein
VKAIRDADRPRAGSRQRAWMLFLVGGVVLGVVYLIVPIAPSKLVVWP